MGCQTFFISMSAVTSQGALGARQPHPDCFTDRPHRTGRYPTTFTGYRLT